MTTTSPVSSSGNGRYVSSPGTRDVSSSLGIVRIWKINIRGSKQ